MGWISAAAAAGFADTSTAAARRIVVAHDGALALDTSNPAKLAAGVGDGDDNGYLVVRDVSMARITIHERNQGAAEITLYGYDAESEEWAPIKVVAGASSAIPCPQNEAVTHPIALHRAYDRLQITKTAAGDCDVWISYRED